MHARGIGILDTRTVTAGGRFRKRTGERKRKRSSGERKLKGGLEELPRGRWSWGWGKEVGRGGGVWECGKDDSARIAGRRKVGGKGVERNG